MFRLAQAAYLAQLQCKYTLKPTRAGGVVLEPANLRKSSCKCLTQVAEHLSHERQV